MPVTLQVPPSASTVSLEERLQRPLLTETLLVVPTKRRIRHLIRAVMSGLGRAVAPGFPFHTLESLARSVAAGLDGALPVTGGPVQTLLFQRAVAGQSHALRYFKARGRDPQLPRGTFGKVVEIILGLKEFGVYPDLLTEELEIAELDELEKLRDMLGIYTAYDEALRNLGVTDLGGMYKSLALECTEAQFTAAFRKIFPSVDFLSLAGFDEFTEPEIGFIRKLCSVPGLNLTLLFDFLPGNPDLFGHLEENYQRFRDLGFGPGCQEGAKSGSSLSLAWGLLPGAEQATADHLARNLFRTGNGIAKESYGGKITLLRARSRVHEIETICRLIKRLAKEKPERDLSAMCVAMRQPELYTDIVREQFPKFGIPVNITDRFDLSRSPLVVDLMGLLQIPLRGYRRDDVLRILCSPYLALGAEDSPFNAGNLTSTARRLRITGGQKSWLAACDRAIGRLGGEQHSPVDREQEKRRAAELLSLRKARQDFAWLLDLMAPLDREQTASEFRDSVNALCLKVRIQERLLRPRTVVHDLPAEKDVRAYAKFLDVVDETTALLDLDGKEKHPWKFYIDRLEVAMSRERYNIREQVGEGVLVTSIEETRGLPLEVMILAGMVDGQFPAMYQPEVFLSAHRRRQREQRHHWQNRYLFYQAAANWRERLIVTWPEKEGELDLVRSPFVDALIKITDAEEADASAAAGFVLASEEEALRLAALDADAGIPVPDTLRSSLAEVVRAQEVERSRLEDHHLPEYEGEIGGALTEAARASLGQIRDRVFSVSQLETYGQCPFRFFAERLLRLRPPEDFEEELTPREKGSLLHDALFEFYTRRRDLGLPPLARCSDEDFQAALNDLVALTRERLAQLSIPDPFWDHECERILGGRRPADGLLYKFLAHEREREDQTVPAFFEAGFGRGTGSEAGRDRRLSQDDPVAAGSVKLRGKVDRIDAGEGFFSIIDYKTGRTLPRLEDIRKGMSLQLPLYLYAVEMMLTARTPVAAAGGFYYQLRDEVKLSPGLANGAFTGSAFEKSRSGQVLKTTEEFRKVIDDSIHLVNDFVRRIVEGTFPLTSPENIDKVCVSCPSKTVCRIQTIRHVQSLPGEDA